MRYRLAAYFDDRLTVWARCRDMRGSRFRYEYAIVRERRARGGGLHEPRRGRSRDVSPDTRAAVARRSGRYGRVVVVVPPRGVVAVVVLPVVVPGGGGASGFFLGLGGAFVPTRTTVSSALYDVFHVSWWTNVPGHVVDGARDGRLARRLTLRLDDGRPLREGRVLHALDRDRPRDLHRPRRADDAALLAAVDRDADPVGLGVSLDEDPFLRVVSELQVERRPVHGRVPAERVAADVERVRVAFGDVEPCLPGRVECRRRDLRGPSTDLLGVLRADDDGRRLEAPRGRPLADRPVEREGAARRDERVVEGLDAQAQVRDPVGGAGVVGLVGRHTAVDAEREQVGGAAGGSRGRDSEACDSARARGRGAEKRSRRHGDVELDAVLAPGRR